MQRFVKFHRFETSRCTLIPYGSFIPSLQECVKFLLQLTKTFTNITNIFTHASGTFTHTRQLFTHSSHPHIKLPIACMNLDIHALKLNTQGLKRARTILHLLVRPHA